MATVAPRVTKSNKMALKDTYSSSYKYPSVLHKYIWLTIQSILMNIHMKKIYLVLFKDQINKIRGTDAIKLMMNVCIIHFVG